MTRTRTTTTKLRRVVEAVLEDHADSSSSSSTTDHNAQLTHLVQSLLLYGRVFRACQAVLHEGTSAAQCTTALHDALRAALHKHKCIDMAATLCHTLLPLFGLSHAAADNAEDSNADERSSDDGADASGLVRVCEVVVSLAGHLMHSKDHTSYERECARLPAVRQVVMLHDPASQSGQNGTASTTTTNTESTPQPQGGMMENTPRAEKRGRTASHERRRTTTRAVATSPQAGHRARAHAAMKYEPITMDTLYGDLLRTASSTSSSSSSSLSSSPSGSAPREDGALHGAQVEGNNTNKEEELMAARDSDVQQQQQQQQQQEEEMQHYVEWMRADCAGELLSTQTYTRFTDLLASTSTKDGKAQRSNGQMNISNKKPPSNSTTEKTSTCRATPDIASLPSTTREALDEVSEVLAAVSRVFCGRTTVDENAWDYGRNRITVAQSSTIYLTQNDEEEEEKKKKEDVERGKDKGEKKPKSDEHEATKDKEKGEEEEGVPLALFDHETGLLYTAAGDVFAMEVTTPERW